VPFVRFARDKRGYEQIFLMDAAPGRDPRMLYCFRTPPGIRVGREPFDDIARQALESRYPDLTFDWKKIASARMPPPPEAEPWRERRRVERAARVAENASPEQDVAENDAESQEPDRMSGSDEAAAAAVVPPTNNDPRDPRQSEPGRRHRRGGRRRRHRGSGPKVDTPSASPGTDAENASVMGPETLDSEAFSGPPDESE